MNAGLPFGGVYRGKTVLVTGHTGFKGSWLALWLHRLGANVVGYALPPTGPQDNFMLCKLDELIDDIHGDIRDMKALRAVFDEYRPDMVFHLAAQAIVRESYARPAETVETNVMGTVNVLECVRQFEETQAAVIVTSDKCYENREQLWGYRECDPMGGYDPYSASKGCAELVAAAWRRSFPGKAIATARAGNVIGGGDWAAHRILPDCVRALRAGMPVEVRSPQAVRPWQHVLEPLSGYLALMQRLLHDPDKFAGPWNFGPCADSIVPVQTVVEQFLKLWGSGSWADCSCPTDPHEATLLSLDCTKARALLGWKPQLSLDEGLKWAADWYRRFEGTDVRAICQRQMEDYSARMLETRGDR